jgi:hypothetical protein
MNGVPQYRRRVVLDWTLEDRLLVLCSVFQIGALGALVFAFSWWRIYNEHAWHHACKNFIR